MRCILVCCRATDHAIARRGALSPIVGVESTISGCNCGQLGHRSRSRGARVYESRRGAIDAAHTFASPAAPCARAVLLGTRAALRCIRAFEEYTRATQRSAHAPRTFIQAARVCIRAEADCLYSAHASIHSAQECAHSAQGCVHSALECPHSAPKSIRAAPTGIHAARCLVFGHTQAFERRQGRSEPRPLGADRPSAPYASPKRRFLRSSILSRLRKAPFFQEAVFSHLRASALTRRRRIASDDELNGST